ncbi:MAG: aspartyl protease family protein [Planctomycetes bacterium]|nr:aspartyl protease family protein [Planctomycetota bacterium]
MAAGRAAFAGLWLAACAARPAESAPAAQLDLAVTALRQGRIEQAQDLVLAVRQRHPEHTAAAQWSAVLYELLWRDDDAVREQSAAIRNARAAGLEAPDVQALRGRLGDLLFQAGRWGECPGPLLAGAHGADAERRRGFASAAYGLPFVRKPSGPLLTEQPLLPGDTPEFLCGAGDRVRPFAIDTGTSMTTVGRSFAAELGLVVTWPAGQALDAAGRALAVEVGVLSQFAVGDVELGATPVLVVDDEALRLRDLFGGPERVPRGVLGLDLLVSFRFTVDPERGSVQLELPRGLPAVDSVQCVRAEGRCLVPVFVEGQRLWFVLDTGASHSSLTAAGVDALPGGAGRAVPSFRRVRTVGGGIVAVREVRDLVLRCSEVRFQGVTLPVVPRGAPALFPVHGVLGIDLLSRCRLTLDRGRARIQAER